MCCYVFMLFALLMCLYVCRILIRCRVGPAVPGKAQCMVCGSMGGLIKLRAYSIYFWFQVPRFSKEELGKIIVHTPFVHPGMLIL